MLEVLKTLRAKLYRAYFRRYNLTQPPVRSKCNEKRPPKYRNIIQKRDVNPLWWIVPPATIFPKYQTPNSPNPEYPLSPNQQPLLHQRSHSLDSLPDHPRIRKDRNQYPLATNMESSSIWPIFQPFQIQPPSDGFSSAWAHTDCEPFKRSTTDSAPNSS